MGKTQTLLLGVLEVMLLTSTNKDMHVLNEIIECFLNTQQHNKACGFILWKDGYLSFHRRKAIFGEKKEKEVIVIKKKKIPKVLVCYLKFLKKCSVSVIMQQVVSTK